MKISEFKSALLNHPDAELRFVLPDGGVVAAHAHITEAGRVDKTFLDCGGTLRRTSYCTLQAWVADDVEHRISPQKLAGIIDLAAPLFEGEDLDVELEYEDGLISQFPLLKADAHKGLLVIFVGTKHTDCLAKDICLPAASTCAPGSGCC